MALIQEPRDSMVGGDPLAVAGESRNGPEAIGDPQHDRPPAADVALPAPRVESVQPGADRVQQRDQLNARVGHVLVLKH
jgi:hypothetical protein